MRRGACGVRLRLPAVMAGVVGLRPALWTFRCEIAALTARSNGPSLGALPIRINPRGLWVFGCDQAPLSVDSDRDYRSSDLSVNRHLFRSSDLVY